MENNHQYNRLHPFLATISERYRLCKQGSKKDTQHLVLDLTGSEIKYQVGDSIGIYPENDPQIVTATLNAMGASGDEKIAGKHAHQVWDLTTYLRSQANITDLQKKLLQEVAFRQTDSIKKALLDELLDETNKERLKAYLANHHLWDFLLAHQEVRFEPQELCTLLMPMLPRFYSISSSQEAVGEEVHLTVAELTYITNGHERRGVCTHYLCYIAPMEKPVVPVFIQPHRGFTLPADPTTSIIMIGPGTGVAPFRAFMQERLVMKEKGIPVGKSWLFFGEWHRATDFFYEEFWNELVDAQALRLTTAFSRDQQEKEYVQHKMLQQGEELFQWLEDGAILYVCGDAEYMAKDVESALLQIIQKHGNRDESNAKLYLKQLRSAKRYLKDVY